MKYDIDQSVNTIEGKLQEAAEHSIVSLAMPEYEIKTELARAYVAGIRRAAQLIACGRSNELCKLIENLETEAEVGPASYKIIQRAEESTP